MVKIKELQVRDKEIVYFEDNGKATFGRRGGRFLIVFSGVVDGHHFNLVVDMEATVVLEGIQGYTRRSVIESFGDILAESSETERLSALTCDGIDRVMENLDYVVTTAQEAQAIIRKATDVKTRQGKETQDIPVGHPEEMGAGGEESSTGAETEGTGSAPG